MNAGSLEIEVQALYGKFESQLREVVSKSEKAAGDAGDKFKKNFESKMGSAGESGASKLGATFLRVFAADAIARSIEVGLKAAVEGNGWQESLGAAIESLPIIGSVSKALGSIFDLALGVTEKNKAIAEEMAALAAQSKENDARRARRKAADSNIEVIGRDIQDIARQKELETIAKSGDAKGAIAKRVELDVSRLQQKLAADLAKSKYDDEKVAMKNRTAAEEDLIRHKASLEIDAIKAAEAAKAEEVAKAEAEKRKDRIDDLALEATKLEGDRKAIAQETGSMSTSFGTFTYAAYTDTEKKQVDQSIVTTLKAIYEEQRRLREGGIA